MLKDITLGQFFPGNSPLHVRDPRIKVISAIIYIVAVFMCQSVSAFVFLLVGSLVLIAISGVPFKIILGGLKPLVFILIFTTAYNVFFHGGEHLLLDIKIAKIYLEGIIFAVIMAVRIICLLIGSSVFLTYTTSPIMLTDGIESLLKPLKVVKLPVHEFAMMTSIALRFIPTMIEETDKIMSAQKARGADFTSGSLIQRAKALVPILIPLFVSAFRRASELAVAMECRCYRGGEGRTRMKQHKVGAGDIILLIILAVCIAAVVLLNVYFPIMKV